MYLKESGPGLKGFKEALGALKQNRVMVGIPEKNARLGRKGELTNVQLAFIHSNGSPKNAIPPRPFLEPAIAQPSVQNEIAEHMKAAAIQALDGNESGMMDELNSAGLAGENAAKEYFRRGDLAPNAPITIHGGWMKNKVSGKVFHVKGKGRNSPLMDTGSLRSSITHVIERK